MITPTVTEITRALEPVDPDMFVDGPTLADPRTRYAPSTQRGRRLTMRNTQDPVGITAAQRAVTNGEHATVWTRAAA